MISVVLQTSGDEEALVRTLSALVSGAADGAVRDVVVVDGASSPAIARIAEGAGCKYLSDSEGRSLLLSERIEAARGQWLLFLAPGAELEEGWFREARQFVERTERAGLGGSRAATFAVEDDNGRRLRGPLASSHGLLIHRSFYAGFGGCRPLPGMESLDLARRIGPRRLQRLRSRLFVTRSVDAELGSGLRRTLGRGLLALRVPTRIVARLYG